MQTTINELKHEIEKLQFALAETEKMWRREKQLKTKWRKKALEGK